MSVRASPDVLASSRKCEDRARLTLKRPQAGDFQASRTGAAMSTGSTPRGERCVTRTSRPSRRLSPPNPDPSAVSLRSVVRRLDADLVEVVLERVPQMDNEGAPRWREALKHPRSTE